MQKGYGDRGQVAIAFTYRRNGVLVSCKYRDINKRFWQEKDTKKVFYGLDDIKGADEIIIVEGEMDKLAMEEAGFRNCVSVPDGAPPSVSPKELPPNQEDTKYQYLWNCKEYLDKVSRIILATDGDPPGQALAEELARRLGRERCWRVKWPKKNTDEHFKDANEVLMFSGPLALRDIIENAELYPIRGLFHFSDYFPEIDAYYNRTLGYEFGASTGWTALNEIYNVMPGELTLVTGVPNSGKSEWIDALLCNLNESVGWKFALCSMENNVRQHARKLLEKHMKKPFFDARYGESAERMSAEELEEGKQWLSDTFYLIRCEDDALPNIKWVLDLARAAVLRHGVRGLVIDPYNELDHQRPPNMTETEYVSQMLTLIKRFAQHHACHVWLVAHPRQLQNWTGQPPNLYDISGSAHFVNKCDNGIVIHRNRNPNAGPIDQVQVLVRKVRNKVVGTIGDAFLSYNSLVLEGDLKVETMTVEVKVEETKVAEVVVVPQEEPEKVVVVEEKKNDVNGDVEVKEVDAADNDGPKTVQKSSSYKEESNFLSDLKEFERKALSELKLKLEEAILGNSLFKKEGAKKKEKEVEKPVEEEKEKEKETKEGEESGEQEGEKKEDVKPEGDNEKEKTVLECEEEKTEVVIEEKSEEIDRDISIWGVPLFPSKGSEGTDVVLLKFLRARDFKVNDALEMLKKTLQWRKESNIDSLLDEEIGVDLSSAFYMNGIDREGHPVCYNIYGVFENEELYAKAFGDEEKRKQFLEMEISINGESDLKNSPSPSKKELRTAMSKAVTLLQDNYPEFVAKNVNIHKCSILVLCFQRPAISFLSSKNQEQICRCSPCQDHRDIAQVCSGRGNPCPIWWLQEENDFEFSSEDGEVSELVIKAGSTKTIEIPAAEVGATLLWDLTVVGWEVNYKEEFVPSDEASYTIIIQKSKKMSSNEEPTRKHFQEQ
ncbi:hypothetical protein NC651_004639 [Populus alba x Populus x berolinensis]|nr:hypothetical protein NC651_004639 [Populus alba x Populus x berolinensis]